MRKFLLTITTTSLVLASTAVMAQESAQTQTQTQAQTQKRVPKVEKASFQTKSATSDAELERVIEEAARIRNYQGGGNVASTTGGGYKVQKLSAEESLKADPAAVPLNYAHRVKQGETLYKLSKKYGVKVSAIQTANALQTSNIAIGQVLVIPTKSKVVATTTVVSEPVTDSTLVQAPDSAVKKVVLPVQAETDAIYAVLPKDTLYGISKRSCVTLDALATTNGIENPNALKPGQKLILPEGHCLSR